MAKPIDAIFRMFVSPCGKVHPRAFIVLRADCSVWLDLVVIRVDGPRGARYKILSFRLQTANGPRSTDFEVCVIFDESLLRYCAAYVWLVAIALNCDFGTGELRFTPPSRPEHARRRGCPTS